MMFFWLIYIFFQSIVYMNFISENKKNLFSNNISNMYSFAYYFFPFILFKQFNMCVYFYYHLIG
jgi:hypothetical protein